MKPKSQHAARDHEIADKPVLSDRGATPAALSAGRGDAPKDAQTHPVLPLVTPVQSSMNDTEAGARDAADVAALRIPPSAPTRNIAAVEGLAARAQQARDKGVAGASEPGATEPPVPTRSTAQVAGLRPLGARSADAAPAPDTASDSDTVTQAPIAEPAPLQAVRPVFTPAQHLDTNPQSSTSRRARPLMMLAMAVIGAVVLAALYGRVMGFDLRRDEFMFLPPAVLLGDGALYQDYFYNHVPYSAWLLRGVHLILPGLGLLEMGRLVVVAAWVLTLGLAGWFGWRLTRSALVAAFCMASLVGADVLLGQTGMAATNNLLPMPFVLMGLGLLALTLHERGLGFRGLFLAGLCLSIAAGLKASAIAFIPAVAIGCFLIPRQLTIGERAQYLALPVALGGLVGAAPLFWLAITQTDLFFAHIASYHAGPHIAYWQANAASEPGLAIGLGGKLLLARGLWLSGAVLLTLFIALVALGGLLRRKQPDPLEEDALPLMLIIALSGLTAAALSFVPTPGFEQYYAPPIIVLPLLIALAMRQLRGAARAQMMPALLIGLMLIVVLSGPRLGAGLMDLRQPERSAPARMARAADALRAAVVTDAPASDGASDASVAPAPGPVLTLSPLYPLEAGLPIYPEFSAGLFGWRVTPYLGEELAARYALVDAEGLPALLEARPPSAILTGFNPELEAPLIAYAEARGFTARAIPEIDDRYGSGVLWLPPEAAKTHLNSGE